MTGSGHDNDYSLVVALRCRCQDPPPKMCVCTLEQAAERPGVIAPRRIVAPGVVGTASVTTYNIASNLARLTRYADWLIAIYDRWEADPRQVSVRLFDAFIAMSHRTRSTTEALWLIPSGLIVIETDGPIEHVDSLKVAYDGAHETYLDVVGHDQDEVRKVPTIIAKRQRLAGRCTTCRNCLVMTICGGGLYVHRYRTRTGFDNPPRKPEPNPFTIEQIVDY
jgi:sulfatase maturation enzyme AslB (radical SAM superfamily)